MSVFSFRAEFLEDFITFKNVCAEQGISFNATVYIDAKLPDVCVEFEVDVAIEVLMTVLRSIVDSHVMLQTLEPLPLKDNPCKRDYDRW